MYHACSALVVVVNDPDARATSCLHMFSAPILHNPEHPPGLSYPVVVGQPMSGSHLLQSQVRSPRNSMLEIAPLWQLTAAQTRHKVATQ